MGVVSNAHKSPFLPKPVPSMAETGSGLEEARCVGYIHDSPQPSQLAHSPACSSLGIDSKFGLSGAKTFLPPEDRLSRSK